MKEQIKKIITAVYGFVKKMLLKIISIAAKTFDLRDVFVFSGTGLIALGTWQIYPPAAAIVAGVIFLYLGIRRIK